MKGKALALALVALAAPACGGAVQAPAAPAHDGPVPASEPRAEMRLRVDLEPGHGCEESFDLALYKNFGVDLVQWEESAGGCTGKVVTIRYLPRRVSAE